MIHFGRVFAMARAELRLSFRLVRYWIFSALALIMACVGFSFHSGLHYFVSGRGASFSLITPRFFAGSYGIQFLLIYMIGVIFLAFDVRARDLRERMGEVLDARPLSNLELLLGRWLGLLVATYLPVLLLALLMLGCGSLYGENPEPTSVLFLITFQALPTLAFCISLVFLVVLLVRKRLIAALLLLGLWIAYLSAFAGWLPTQLTSFPLMDIMGANGFGPQTTTTFPSDITATLPSVGGILQRLAVLAGALGLLLLASLAHPRRDDDSVARNGGLAALLLACLVAAGLSGYLSMRTAVKDFRHWSKVHEQHRSDPAPDLLALRGVARIDPGTQIHLDLELELGTGHEASLGSLLFSLNPGYAIHQVEVDTQPCTHSFEDGLLRVDLSSPLSAGDRATVHLVADGLPDEAFAYLGDGESPLEAKLNDGLIFLLGYRPLFFEADDFALLDGVRWLPATGAEIGRGAPDLRGSDFFDLDLVVDLPEELVVAGPGRRQPLDDAEAGRARVRFAPGAPLPGVALVAGHYVSRTIEVDGVLLEVLLDDDHTAAFDVFEDAGAEIQTWIEERLSDAKDLGLEYPYDAFTLVEVPNALRGYGGGWRQDTTLAQPAMALLRESGFPTARFDVKFKNPADFADVEGGMGGAKKAALLTFFGGDVIGGNPILNATRNFFRDQTAAIGPGGLALNHVFSELSERLIVDDTGYFSARLFKAEQGNQTIQTTLMTSALNGGAGPDSSLRRNQTQRVGVWDTVLTVSLNTLDPRKKPQDTLDVLTLKGGGMVRSLLDGLGRERSGELLAQLRKTHRGQTFTRDDVAALGESLDTDLASWLSVWLDETDLPAFVAEEARAFRLPDSEDGTPRYQVLLRLRNDGPVAGHCMMQTYFGDSSAPSKSEPLRIEAHSEVELGDVVSKPPTTVHLEPYLALNRRGFGITPEADDIEQTVDGEPFVGIRELEYSVPESASIVVDDLDEGHFRANEKEGRSFFRLGGRAGEDQDLDGGIPANRVGPPPSRWERVQIWGAYGKYRHTAAVVSPKNEEQTAVFTAELPEDGSWSLEFFVATGLRQRILGVQGSMPKTYDLTIEDSSGAQELSFDASAAVAGWNLLGEFELAGGEVSVEVAAGEGSRLIVADAIRWTPAGKIAKEGSE